MTPRVLWIFVAGLLPAFAAVYFYLRRPPLVIVAILDTGVDLERMEFKKRLAFNYKDVPTDGIDNEANGYADDFFGWSFVRTARAVHTTHTSHAPPASPESPDSRTSSATAALTASSNDVQDHDGHGTETALAILAAEPTVVLLPIKIAEHAKPVAGRAGGPVTKYAGGPVPLNSFLEAMNYARARGARRIHIGLEPPTRKGSSDESRWSATIKQFTDDGIEVVRSGFGKPDSERSGLEQPFGQPLEQPRLGLSRETSTVRR